MKNTRWLLDCTKELIYSIQLCQECYMNAINCPSEWFTMVCKQPHLLVWAKQKSYPYWPAKLMSVNQDKGTVDVRFFGDQHSRAILTAKDCLMYSRKNPSVILGTHKASLEKDEKVSIQILRAFEKKNHSNCSINFQNPFFPFCLQFKGIITLSIQLC